MRSGVLLRALVVSFVLALGVAAAACGGSSSSATSDEAGVVTGTGVQKTQTFDLSGFTSVRVSQGFSVVIEKGDSFAVSASVNENLVDHLQVEVQGDTLVIALDPAKTYRLADLSAQVTMPELAGLEVQGNADAYATGFKSKGDVSLKASGAGRISVDGMKAASATLAVSEGGMLGGKMVVSGALVMSAAGASQAIVAGAARTVELTADGASEVSLKDLAAVTASVTLSGGSRASVRASKTVDVSLAEASSLDLYGTAELGETNVQGASQINRIQ